MENKKKTQAGINRASADKMIIDYYENWLTLSAAGSNMQMFHLWLDELQIHLQDLRGRFYGSFVSLLLRVV